MNAEEQKIYNLVRLELKDEFIPKKYRAKVNSRYCGHCHHATIAMYCLLGGKEKGYKVRKAVDELQIKHYWLETASGEVIDPTVEQYTELSRNPPYENAVATGVSYRKTKAAKEIITKVKEKLEKG